MKQRQRELISYIIEDEYDINSLILKLKVSKRTLYYDIEELNYIVKNYGQIKKIKKKYYFIGDLQELNKLLTNIKPVINYSEVYNHILYKILNNEFTTIKDVAEQLDASKNTIVNIINQIKIDLKEKDIIIDYLDHYEIRGNEFNIRNLFISLMYEDNNIINNEIDIIKQIDNKYNLQLTDFSKAFLSTYYNFVSTRNRQGYYLKKEYFIIEDKLDLNFSLKLNSNEINFFIAYLKSLSSTNNGNVLETINAIVFKLLHQLDLYAIDIVNRSQFIRNISKHLESSYFRIKFGFPIKNLVLEDIKLHNNYIFTITKRILNNKILFPELDGIKEEEIAFIASYIGGYINNSKKIKNRLLIVCPQGLMTSNIIKQQLVLNIPSIQIVDTISLSQLQNYDNDYDYIISTISLDFKKVIVVNQILSKLDIQTIISLCFRNFDLTSNLSINPLIDLISKTCQINDIKNLERDLKKFFNIENRKEQPMLNELITKERIQIVNEVKDWEQAIKLASKPLIDDESINHDYIESMINSIKEHGPYIVLQDRFAMPHASNTGGVNRLAISILVTKKAVDLLGKEVNIFFVLAPIDNSSHLKALVAMTELFSDIANINKVINGDVNTILQLIDTERS